MYFVNFSSQTSGVNAPVCLTFIKPSFPIKKVSGAPYTPKSIANLPSGSKILNLNINEIISQLLII